MPAAAQEGTGGKAPDPYENLQDWLTPRSAARWIPTASVGFDALLHTYPLAMTDTTETISEAFAAVGLEGRSGRVGPHRWRLQAGFSFGNELFRENLKAQWKYLDERRVTRWRLDGDLAGRQYQEDTGYSLASNNLEGRLTARAVPWVTQDHLLELRLDTGLMEYSNPSALEVRHRDAGAGVQYGSRLLAATPWRVAYRFAGRAYPDSAVIDRHTHSLEGDLEWRDPAGLTLHLYHATRRRLIRDEGLKPSAWMHWSDVSAQMPAGVGDVYLDVQSEIWRYDEESAVYLDSWQLDGVLGYRWGDLMRAGWRLGLAVENLAAGDSPETYTQLGLRGGVESYGTDLNGSLQVEYGRRHYHQTGGWDLLNDFSNDGSTGDLEFTYSDFHYFEIWLMGGWTISKNLRLDLMASYEPESHTEQDDDVSLGYASVRLVWHPRSWP